MSNGWYFALGWIGCNAFIAWGMPGPWLESLARSLKRLARRRRWTIGGVVYRPRRLTRTVMEQITQHQVGPVFAVHGMGGLAAMLSGVSPDEDELRQQHLKANAERIESMYQTCAAVLRDADGSPPSVEVLSDELTCDQVSKIIQGVLT